MRTWEDSLKQRLAVSPDYSIDYLNAVLEERDEAAFLLALRQVIEAQGQSTVGVESRCENLYRSLAENAQARLTSVTELLDALGFQLIITRKEAA